MKYFEHKHTFHSSQNTAWEMQINKSLHPNDIIMLLYQGKIESLIVPQNDHLVCIANCNVDNFIVEMLLPAENFRTYKIDEGV